MSKGISVVYITNRITCKFEWVFDSLTNQQKGHTDTPIEIILVDSLKKARGSEFVEYLSKHQINHVSPLPSPVQGEHRLTSIDWWSASVARNTGFANAKFDYIVFVDDLSILMPGWLDAVVQAANENYCVLGTYEKRNDMVVENGKLVSSAEIDGGFDQRLLQINQQKLRHRAKGDWLFGCSFGLPVEYALQIGGFDHICDCISMEDCQFGIRIGRTGIGIYLDTRMKTIESAELHFVERNYYKRASFPCSKDKYFEMLAKYGILERPERPDEKYDAAWFITDLLKYFPDQTASFHNTYDLRALRNKVLAGETITVKDMNFATEFWWDGTPFLEM